MMSGSLDITLDGETLHCVKNDFVWVECGVCHELRAVTNVRIITIGCELQK